MWWKYDSNKEKEELPCPTPTLQQLSDVEFKRLCGVSRNTFEEIVKVLHPDLKRSCQRGGQNNLSTQDQLLVTLEYWREYRSQFHIAKSWGLHETTVASKNAI